MAHTDLHAATEKKVRDARANNKAPSAAPAKEYPSEIAKPTTPDETQELAENPRVNTWHKGWLTRSRIYERKLPGSQEVGALRVDGPGDSFLSLRHDGAIRLVTGVKDPNRGPQSGQLGIKTYGQQQEHLGRSDLQFNYGDDDEKQALTVLCYGDYVETTKGHTRYINATKILISASSELVLEGGSVKIQSESDLELTGSSITTAQVNKKDIVLGQNKTQGAGENTTEQFDPRSTTVINTPGSLQWNIAQDFQLLAGGAMRVTATGGPGTLIKDRVFGMSLVTGTDFSVSGGKSAGFYSLGPIDIGGTELSVTAGDTDITTTQLDLTTANIEVDAAAVSITGTGDVEITSAGNVRLTGALIFLN